MIDHDPLCDIDLCGAWPKVTIAHPQRGTMTVCDLHAERIRRLPESRFGDQEAAQ